LLGIFLFPGIFQSVHTACHKKECCAGHEIACEAGLPPHKDLQTNTINEHQQEKQCPVCNYQFPANQLPEYAVYEKIIPQRTGFIRETITNNYFRIVFTASSPRAPPV
jgi:hypothetical protein